MATQLQSPGTMADDSSVGTVAWSNPDNAKVRDNVYATVLGGTGGSHYLKATNFGFTIPAGATINGLLAEVEVKHNGSDFWYGYGYAVKGGVIQTPQFQLTDFSPSEVYRSFGSSSDLWDETWTPADINDSSFGFAFYSSINDGAITSSVDHIRITVYYTEAFVSPFPTFFQISSGGVTGAAG